MTIGGLIDDLAQRHGDRLALIARDRRLTFRALATESTRAAAALARGGVHAGSHVGILMPNCAEWLITAIGAWKLGAVIVPLNTLWREGELAYALRHADVSVLVMVSQFLRHDYAAMLAHLCPELAGAAGRAIESVALPSLRRVIVHSGTPLAGATQFNDLLADADAVRPYPTEAADEPAAIFFTSGSTAAPKGVVHTHASMLCAARNVADALGITPTDRTWGYLPFFFNGGLVGVALATLSHGAAVVLQPVFEPGETLELMRREQCTVLFAWPHQAQALIAHPSFDRTALLLRKGPGANAPWAAQLYPPDHQAVGSWGMTETGPMACSTRFDDPMPARASSHGRAMPGLEVRVVDPESGAALPAERDGEIVVRGASLMKQYYKIDPAECVDSDGYFHTGDLGRLDASGHLHFVGRLRDVVKTAGVNVSAAEVEAALLAHPAVRVAYVTAVADPHRGENVAAFIVARASGDPRDDVLAFCREQLAAYKVPRHLFMCSEDDLPVLGSGKIDKQRLRLLAAEWARK